MYMQRSSSPNNQAGSEDYLNKATRRTAAGRVNPESLTDSPHQSERQDANNKGILVKTGVAAILLTTLIGQINSIREGLGSVVANIDKKLRNDSEPLTFKSFFTTPEDREAELEKKAQDLEIQRFLRTREKLLLLAKHSSEMEEAMNDYDKAYAEGANELEMKELHRGIMKLTQPLIGTLVDQVTTGNPKDGSSPSRLEAAKGAFPIMVRGLNYFVDTEYKDEVVKRMGEISQRFSEMETEIKDIPQDDCDTFVQRFNLSLEQSTPSLDDYLTSKD